MVVAGNDDDNKNKTDEDGLFVLAVERYGKLVEITEPVFNTSHAYC